MHFALTEEQQMIAETARNFATTELAPVAAMLDETGGREQLLANLKQLAALGFMGLNIKAEYGGTEAGVVAFSLAITELAKACASTAVTVSVSNMVAEVIQAMGTEAQKQHYLPRLCGGEFYAGGFCLTESGAGSDPAGMKTRAVKDGDHYVLSGAKLYITSAEYAGVFVVWAVTDPAAKKGKGISCFLVDAGTPGLTIGKAEHKMGQKASATNEVHFDQCRVPASAMLGAENDGFRIAVAELAGGRIGIGSLALGVGLAAMDYAGRYIAEREQFGQPLINFQGLQWMLADRATELEAARLLVMQAAWLKEQGAPFSKAASMAKLFASEKANEACYTALQMLGGAGYLKEYPVERMARDVRITTIYEGTSEVQRIVIARELIKELNQ
ncbi:acyl-CoA dehydrogenase family protein [Simiduia agarivorans]|uniref:3-sulfinopropanoyl-CoA desulfinase n=1 Tax=Simiduia agarivorans (strain DSM 21679 / JCM 13881 / BCRC 17597 / SA1) TaxID=1117647 RepID=K4KRF0_SIMAS|nr:acyl-CoA dehydrogenase family protein [Simiduia agarivorans]AFV00866.1 Acyl-CoA dehydrogenase-like protein [Simiduia agarivorans SA1 = DSM 21679]